VEVKDYFKATLTRAENTLLRALDGLSPDDLRKQPAGPGSNPIGWLAWHLSRVQDGWMTRIAGGKQEWEEHGWAAKFGFNGDPPQYTPDNVHTFDGMNAELLLGYYKAVRARTDARLDALTSADYDRELPPPAPGRPAMTVGAVLALIMGDNLQHIGQIAYLRGLIKGQGWY